MSPVPENDWESAATFNPTISATDDGYTMLYRAVGKNNRSVIGKAVSKDGYAFSGRIPFIVPDSEIDKYGCEDPRMTKIEGRYYIFYTALSRMPFSYRGIRVAVAVSDDLKTIKEKHPVTPFNAKAMTLFPEKIDGYYYVFFTVNTDNPPSYNVYAKMKRLDSLWDGDFWKEWYEDRKSYILPFRRIGTDGVEIGAPPVKTEHGWVLTYSYIKHYFNPALPKQFRIEAVLLDSLFPEHIIGRIEEPLLTSDAPYEKAGMVNDIVFPTGTLIEKDKIRIYYGAADTRCAVAQQNLDSFMKAFETSHPTTLKCSRFPHNPLLRPLPENEWENASVFNPAAIELEGITYLLYRASSDKNVSRIGLAVSRDGLLIDERLNDPIYSFRMPFETPSRKDGPGGCEDMRVTRIGDMLYLLYTAYDGRIPRLALSSIPVADFIGRNWNAFALPKIISAPAIADKDGVLFPEKIGGKYVIFHRVEPNICIDFVDSLEFPSGAFLKSSKIIEPHRMAWDSKKIGINTPPIKTDKGWLVLYHGISAVDGYYRLGALLLDLADVSRVIGWTQYPILEPETAEEKYGVVDNVVFPCGCVLKNDEIYIYYGGADRVVCGATISLTKLLDYLEKSVTKTYLKT